MLVLSRQRDETIMIGDEIEITVVDIRGDKVRLGISAPTRIAVHRKEVYDAISRENEQAARVGGVVLTGSDLEALAQTVQPGPRRTAQRAAALVSPAPLAKSNLTGPAGVIAQGPQDGLRRETA
jgi:carbon storage regulator